jgi:hypothetical protein
LAADGRRQRVGDWDDREDEFEDTSSTEDEDFFDGDDYEDDFDDTEEIEFSNFDDSLDDDIDDVEDYDEE